MDILAFAWLVFPLIATFALLSKAELFATIMLSMTPLAAIGTQIALHHFHKDHGDDQSS